MIDRQYYSARPWPSVIQKICAVPDVAGSESAVAMSRAVARKPRRVGLWCANEAVGRSEGLKSAEDGRAGPSTSAFWRTSVPGPGKRE